MANQKTVKTKGLVLCALFASLIAVGAFIKIPIPVVPFTLQFLFTNLAGLLLGRRLGAVAVAVYLAVGLIGLPIFASGGGISYVLYPTFGYLIGFLVGTYMAGLVAERLKSKKFGVALSAGFVNLAFVYAFGMVYYYLIANYYMQSPIGVWTLLLYCFILAVPGDIAICFVSALLYRRLAHVLQKDQIV